MIPAEGRATARPDEGDPDEQETRSGSWGLWTAVGFLTTGAFAAGFLVGVISDGNAEMMREFREKSPSTNVVSAAAQQNMSQPVPSPSPTRASTEAERRANNQVDWAISMAPGTNVAPIDVRTADLDADTRMEFGTIYGNQVSPVATLWVRAGSAAKIVLPIGNYSVRTTRIPLKREDGGGNAEPEIISGVMMVGRIEKDVSPPLVAGNRTGTWRIANPTAYVTAKNGTKKRSKRPRATKFEYEGLGQSSRTDEDPEYEN